MQNISVWRLQSGKACCFPLVSLHEQWWACLVASSKDLAVFSALRWLPARRGQSGTRRCSREELGHLLLKPYFLRTPSSFGGTQASMV